MSRILIMEDEKQIQETLKIFWRQRDMMFLWLKMEKYISITKDNHDHQTVNLKYHILGIYLKREKT